jgi:hypothetical protein
MVQSQPRQIVHKTLSQKNSPQKNKKMHHNKKGLKEHLPTMPSQCEALSSNPSAAKKKKIHLSSMNS